MARSFDKSTRGWLERLSDKSGSGVDRPPALPPPGDGRISAHRMKATADQYTSQCHFARRGDTSNCNGSGKLIPKRRFPHFSKIRERVLESRLPSPDSIVAGGTKDLGPGGVGHFLQPILVEQVNQRKINFEIVG